MFLPRNGSSCYSRVCLLARSNLDQNISPWSRSPRGCSWPQAFFYCSSVVVQQKPCAETNTTTTSVVTSNRQKFRNIPIHPSILSYIQKIGVGIPERSTRRKRQNRRSQINIIHSDNGQYQQQLTRPDWRRRPLGTKPATHRHLDDSNSSALSSSNENALPPPPFGPGSRVRVIATCTSSNDFPSPTSSRTITTSSNTARRPRIPEVAMAGRSNVGKSTLLNALLYGNKHSPGLGKGSNKAAVSDTPGETRAITFYEIISSSSPTLMSTQSISSSNHLSGTDGAKKGAESKSALRLVDLPGYGFAFVSSEQKEEFQTLLVDYLLHRGRNHLKRILLLLDARHGLKKTDVDFLTLLQDHAATSGSGRNNQLWLPPIQVVLTKCDMVSQHDLARRVSEVKQDLSDCWRREPSQLPILLVSAKTSLSQYHHKQQSNRRTDDASSHSTTTPPKGGLLELQKELAALVPHTKGVGPATGTRSGDAQRKK